MPLSCDEKIDEPSVYSWKQKSVEILKTETKAGKLILSL